MGDMEKTPYVVYDNQCYLCTRFAKMIRFFSRGNIAIIGHYSDLGQSIREKILDDSALKMFWFIDKKYAFGGRAALWPLLRAMITSDRIEQISVRIDDNCGQECKTIKAVFIRSASLLSNSRKIKID